MIGFFDSGFGGLTVLRRVVEVLPQYDYLYLGDNARAPYGSRSQKVVYEFTREAVAYLFRQGCPLIIIACNTSSAKALRRIQQEYLPLTTPTAASWASYVRWLRKWPAGGPSIAWACWPRRGSSPLRLT